MIEPSWLDYNLVCAIQNEIIAESGGATGILNKVALESTLNKPKNWYYYSDNASLYDLAAAYGYGFIKNHCFIDGNKRVSLIAVYTFWAMNNIELVVSETDAVTFFLELATTSVTQEDTIEKFSKWLKLNSEEYT